jgi:hypothetical protein
LEQVCGSSRLEFVEGDILDVKLADEPVSEVDAMVHFVGGVTPRSFKPWSVRLVLTNLVAGRRRSTPRYGTIFCTFITCRPTRHTARLRMDPERRVTPST